MAKIYWRVDHNQIAVDEPIQAFFRTEPTAKKFALEHIAAGGSATDPIEVVLCEDRDRRNIILIEMEIKRREFRTGSEKA